MLEDDQAPSPAQDTALRVALLVIGALMVGLFGYSGHLERHNRAAQGVETVNRLFEDVDEDMLVQDDLYAISSFLTREQRERDMAILRLSDDVALTCRLSPEGDFYAELRDVIDDKVSDWTWPEKTERPMAIDALCGMMMGTVLAAKDR